MKKILFYAITILPLIGGLSLLFYITVLTNIPQLLYTQSIRNIYFECMDFVNEKYVYKMKPGQCNLSNIEYNTILTHNNNGFRGMNDYFGYDYDIVAIGDSMTHGFGVNDDETFSRLLESKYNYKTINLGVGSYATMRELETLKKYGANAKYVLLQYCNNDFGENEASVRLDEGEFGRQAALAWRSLMTNYHAGKAEGFGKPLRDLGIMLKNGSFASKSAWRRSPLQRPIADEARAVAQILSRYRQILEGKRLIVFELSTWGLVSPVFDTAFDAELRTIGWLRFRTVNTANVLGYTDYYFLDGHLRPIGHRKLAETIADEIAKWEAMEPTGK